MHCPHPPLTHAIVIFVLLLKGIGVAQAQGKAKVLDPIRPGDQVEYYFFGKWNPATILEYADGYASITYKSGSFDRERKVALKKLRFPNDEGTWMWWSDETGKFRIEARLISRNETHVTLRKDDGNEVKVPIKKLNRSLQNRIAKIDNTIKKMKKESLVRVGDQIEVKSSWTWYPGTVTKILPAGATVTFDTGRKEKELDFEYDEMRYPNNEGPWREWKDSSGKHTVVARYLTHSLTHVVLLTEARKTVRLERQKLSGKLQRELNQATLFTRRPKEVPFGLAGSKYESEQSWTSFGKKLPPFDVDQLSVTPSDDPVSLPEGGFEFPIGTATRVSLVVPIGQVPSNGLTKSSGSSSESVSSNPSWIAIGVDDPSDSSTAPSKIYWADIAASRAEPGPNFLPDEIFLGYSAKQQRLLTAEVRGRRSTLIRFCTYRLAPGGKAAKPELKWSVPETRFASSSSATQAAFLDDDRVLIGYGGYVGLWNLATKMMEYSVPSSGNSINLSPDKRYFGTNQFSHSVVVETETGKPVSDIERHDECNFSQDGRYLISLGTFGGRVDDLQDPSKSIFLPGSSWRTPLGPPPFSTVADGWISDGQSVWSLERGILAWSYSTRSNDMKIVSQSAVGDKLLAIGSRKLPSSETSVLIGSAKIPHAAAIAANEAVDFQKLYVLKRGARVRLDPGVQDSRMVSGIERAAANQGWVIDDSSDLVISANAGPGDNITRTYERSRFGFPSGFGSSGGFGAPSGFGASRGSRARRQPSPETRETVSVRPWYQRVTVSRGSESLWGTSSGGLLGMLMIEKGKSLQAKANQCAQPSYDLFDQFEFPERIMEPKYKRGLGTSTISAQGLVDHPIE